MSSPEFIIPMIRDELKCIHIGDMEAYEKAEQYFANQTCEFEMVWRKKVNARSNSQNAYYWSVVIKTIADHYKLTTRQQLEVLHDYLRCKYLKRTVFFENSSEVKVLSTSELTAQEFQDYLEKIRMWASVRLDLCIPTPNDCPIPDSFISC